MVIQSHGSVVQFDLRPNLACFLDEMLLPSAVNDTFRNYRVRDKYQNEVRNEEA